MQTTEPAGRPHRNHGLFSDHYLNVTLPGRPGWRALAGEAEGLRVRNWAYVEELVELRMPSYLRVVTLEDGETVHNAFSDRNYARNSERKNQ